MGIKSITELITDDNFRQDVIKYLNILEDANFEVTVDDDVDEISSFWKLFVSSTEKNYLITIEIEDNGDYIFIDSEDMDKIIDSEKFNFDIDYWSYNITYDQLARLFESGKILIPQMQRGFVWDDIQASRLIESILMGLPLPSLFLIKNIEEGNYLVVDGLQRITSIHSFRYNKKLPNRKPNVAGFSLKGVHKEIANKTYAELLEEGKTDKFDMGTINVIEFKQNKPDREEAMYTLFERLNGGGTNLTPQQIRNSIYYGKFNNFLNEYSKTLNKYFSEKAILNLLPSETLLRVISIHRYILDNHNDIILNNYKNFDDLTSSIAYKKILNDTSNKYHLEYKILERQPRNIKLKEHEKELENYFKLIDNSIIMCESIFKEEAFVRFDYEKNEFLGRFTPIILESLIVTMLLNKGKQLRSEEEIISSFKKLFLEKGNFEKYFSQGTGRLKNIFGRIVSMQEVLYDSSKL